MCAVLVVGNGFDLHHEKQTRYSDFLDFLELIENENYKKEHQDKLHNISFSYKGAANSSLTSFLLAQHSYNKEKSNWIDMEGEIKRLIHTLADFIDECNETITRGNKGNRNSYKYESLPVEYQVLVGNLCTIFERSKTAGFYSWKREFINSWGFVDKDKIFDVINQELHDISNLICFYLKEIEPTYRNRKVVHKELMNSINPKYVISFNYTETCQELYGIERRSICYVHGNVSEMNAVLGYDDSDNREDDILFKKYYRRIIQKADIIKDANISEYLEDGYQASVPIYFFGHSLDVSDEDILKRLIGSSEKITIFVMGPSDQAQKVKNLFKYMNKEDVINRIEKGEIVFKHIYSNV